MQTQYKTVTVKKGEDVPYVVFNIAQLRKMIAAIEANDTARGRTVDDTSSAVFDAPLIKEKWTDGVQVSSAQIQLRYPHSSIAASEGMHAYKTAEIRHLDEGDFFRRVKDGPVWVRGKYVSSLRKYSVWKADDVNHESFVKPDFTVFYGFTY